MTHPMQPVERDNDGMLRFKRNAIVRVLLDVGPLSMNALASMDFTDDDRAQFAQLIGYSLRGFSELSYVRDEQVEVAKRMAQGASEEQAKIATLEQTLAAVREKLAPVVPLLYAIHPDDLTRPR